MMLTNKEKILLQHLLKNRGGYTTSKELAKILNCSDRTIRTYIKNISEEIEGYSGVRLDSKQGQGYQLHFETSKAFNTLASDFGADDSGVVNIENSDINDRYKYILNKLLLEQEELYFEDLIDELYVSRSTLSSDFKKIRNDLMPYGLTIESRANKGVYVSGDEQHIRKFIMDHFFNNGFFQTLYSYVDEELIHGKINFEALTVIVLDECREGGLKLSDFVIQNLVVHIALAIRRLSEGFRISEMETVLIDKYQKEYEVAKKMMARIAKATKLDFPDSEIAYITLHLISKGQHLENHSEDDTISWMRVELVRTLSEMDSTLTGYLMEDFQFLEGLSTHLATLYLRSENGIALENPLLEDIKANYNESFDFAKRILSRLKPFQKLQPSDDEVAYVALHILAAQERYKDQFKFNVLVICATGYGSAQMLKSRIENELRQYVTISDVIGYYDITDDKLENIDFIISSIDLSNLIFSIPVFTTSVFLKENELKEIIEKIKTMEKSRKRSSFSELKSENHGLETIFDNVFSQDLFYISHESSVSKEDIINQLISQLGQDENDKFQSRFLDMLEQRERLSSILFNERIAVPHPIKPVSNFLKMAVAVIPDGVNWDGQSNAVKLVFLPSISREDNDGLKEITNRIVEITEDDDWQERLVSSQTFDEFRQIFIQGGKQK